MGYTGPYRGYKDWESLTGQQRAFVEAYVSNGGNAVQAYKTAGYYTHKTYKSEKAKAYKVRHNKHIAHHIRRILRDTQMSEEEALARTAEVGAFDIGEYLFQYPATCPHCGEDLDVGGLVGLDLEKMKKDGATRVLKSVKNTRNGVQVELYPADESRRDIMKAHGTFTQKHERQIGGLAEIMTQIARERQLGATNGQILEEGDD